MKTGAPLKRLDEKELLVVTGGEHVSRPTWTMNEYITIGRAWCKAEVEDGPRGGFKEALRVREERLLEDWEG